jgi:hypothetical protein
MERRSIRAMRRSVGPAAILFLVATNVSAKPPAARIAVPPAEASEEPSPSTPAFGYLSPGVLLSFVGAPREGNVGLGGELSWMHFTSAEAFGVGVFTQAQTYSFDHGRYAAGLQLGKMLGAEVGYAYRAPHGVFAGTHAAHLGVYWSLGILELAGRFSVPLAAQAGSKPAMGLETALTVGFKAPLPIYGTDHRFDRMFYFMGGG